MWLLRHSRQLKVHLGGVIDAVERNDSLGEVYFPLGIAGLYILSGGDPLRFSIPILLLALADALAALIGIRYGQRHYTTAEGYKTVEGSLAFFITAFFSVHLPLLLFSETGRLETLLIALILGLLMMLVEAVAWRGLDNLFIPIIGFLLLNSLLAMGPGALVGRLILTVLLVMFTLLWRNRANLQDSALLGVALIGYLSWTLADWRWFVIPLIVFLNHLRLSSAGYGYPARASTPKIGDSLVEGKVQSGQPYNIYAVISVASGGMLWLFLFQGLARAELFYLFTLTFAAQLAMLALVALKRRKADLSPLRLLGLSVFQGWLFLFVPFILITGVTPLIIKDSLVALLGVGLAALAFYYLQPAPETYPTDLARWLRQAGCAMLGSLVGLGPLYFM
jgi:phytol kinase